MSIVERLDEEELALLEIIRHPLWLGEFVRSFTDDGDHIDWEYTDYQKEFICDFHQFVSICTARSVGKTTILIDRLVWYALNDFWGETILFTVPSRVHMEPVFLRLKKWFRRHPFLEHYAGRTGINSQSYIIKLKNQAVVDFRIAGQTGTGANVIGMHVPVVILDEAAFYNWGTWVELLPTLNQWMEGNQLIVAGVPTGLREKNVLFYVDQKDDRFSKHRVTAHDNPRYAEEDDKRNLERYGGEKSEEYQHLILGKHGIPSYAMFDRANMLIEDYGVFTGSIYGQKLRKDKTYLTRLFNALPAKPGRVFYSVFGADLGYSDPSSYMYLYKERPESPWKYLFRIMLHQVDYNKQEKLIDRLDTKYKPDILGIDAGHAGKALTQNLMVDPIYKRKNYGQRLFPIEFSSNVVIGLDLDGEETTVRAKQFGMQLLQSEVNNHNYCFTWKDESLINELERTSYRRTASGDLVFRTVTPRGGIRHGQDHNLAALLSGILAHYKATEVGQLRRERTKLYKPRWGLF